MTIELPSNPARGSIDDVLLASMMKAFISCGRDDLASQLIAAYSKHDSATADLLSEMRKILILVKACKHD